MKTPQEWAREFTGGQHTKLIAMVQADARAELLTRISELETQLAKARELLLATDDAEMLFSWHAQVYDWLERTDPDGGK